MRRLTRQRCQVDLLLRPVYEHQQRVDRCRRRAVPTAAGARSRVSVRADFGARYLSSCVTVDMPEIVSRCRSLLTSTLYDVAITGIRVSFDIALDPLYSMQ